MKYLIGIIGLLWSITATAGERTIYTAQYKGEYMGLSVELNKSIKQLNDNQYELLYVIDSFLGSIKEREVFVWQNGEIKPILYSYNQKIFGAKKRRGITWDWAHNVAVVSRDDKQSTIEFPAKVLGPLSYQLKIQMDVYNRKDTLSYSFIRKNRLENYVFEYLENESASSTLTTVIKQDGDSEKKTLLTFDQSKQSTLVELEQLEEDSYKLTMTSEKYFYPLAGTPLDFAEKESL